MDQLKPLIDELVRVIQSGGNVVTEQMPDVAQQIVRLYLWGNVIEIPLLLAVMLGIGMGVRWAHRKFNAWEFMIPVYAGSIGLEIGIALTLYDCFQTLLKAIFAPKLLIIETLMHLK